MRFTNLERPFCLTLLLYLFLPHSTCTAPIIYNGSPCDSMDIMALFVFIGLTAPSHPPTQTSSLYDSRRSDMSNIAFLKFQPSLNVNRQR
uniref:Secreted protein n=1 Tax=Pyxicephalus adspersus TaxID=30357 RepID=A0AAV2ZLP4_PYXAD|nr:TPA: hypothetical protein GDO54_005643 [Pyxicephalus adspersus]